MANNFERGKFIVLYGSNNLGKSEQIKLLAKEIQKNGIPVERIKYPIYELEPTGPLINKVLRHGYPMCELDLQVNFAQNRRDYEPILNSKLENGVWVVAEDYKGTGIAWGVTRGIPVEVLEVINWGLKDEDKAILLNGSRFVQGIESQHRNEADSVAWERSKRIHLLLADRYGWEIVNSNGSIKEIHNRVMRHL